MFRLMCSSLRRVPSHGLTVRGATPVEIQQYNLARDTALQYRSQLKNLYKERKTALNRQIHGLEPVGSEEHIKRNIIQVTAALEPLEERLTLALTPGSGSPAARHGSCNQCQRHAPGD